MASEIASRAWYSLFKRSASCGGSICSFTMLNIYTDQDPVQDGLLSADRGTLLPGFASICRAMKFDAEAAEILALRKSCCPVDQPRSSRPDRRGKRSD